jgi:dihydroneopterin aldolase
METITIEINKLLIHARHGVMDQERIVGNDFRVSARLVYPAGEAIESDKLDGTLNYADACDEIRKVMATPSALLEHVCGRLRTNLTTRFPLIINGSVKVEKLNPPIPGTQMESVAVELSW